MKSSFMMKLIVNKRKNAGIAYGEDYGDIVNNISSFYGEKNVYSITIRFSEDYDQLVLPQDTIESILALKDDV